MKRSELKNRNSLNDSLVALASLLSILDNILLLELTHPLNLIQVDHEAIIVRMERLDALPAENVLCTGTVKVLDALWMNFTELVGERLLIFVLEIEAHILQDRVLLDDLVEDVDVEGQTLSTFKLLDQLATDGAPNPILVVQLSDAACAECMPAVDQDARDSFTHVVLESAELADVKTTGLVVEVHPGSAHYDEKWIVF